MQFVLYCLCGGTGVATDYVIYFLTFSAGLWYQAANILGYVAGTLVSFFLNRRFTFGVADRTAARLAMFLGVAAVGYAASALLLWLLVSVWAIDGRLAKLLTLPVVVAIQYGLNRSITFRDAARLRSAAASTDE